MAIKPFEKDNSTQPIASKVRDAQQNLFEFTLMTASKTDFSTFDVLSITRADVTPNYQCQTMHRKVHTQGTRVASQSALIIPWPKRK